MTDWRDHVPSEAEILEEIEQFALLMQAVSEGKRGDELNRPLHPDGPSSIVVTAFHVLIEISSSVARRLGAHRILSVLARMRIATDRWSYESRACAWNFAHTNLGLVLLARNDVKGAIACLDASWRVHPCPHNSTYGLSQRLATALRKQPEARAALAQYDCMSRRFVACLRGLRPNRG
jgi:hypothetical protein